MARILLVEDNKMSQKMMYYTLKRLGLETDYAEDGAEAVQKATEGGYDIVLMDIMMPVFDGYEATRRIRQSEKEQADGRHTLIIGLTGNVYDMEEQKCLQAGMDGYLAKPFDAEAFMQMAREKGAI